MTPPPRRGAAPTLGIVLLLLLTVLLGTLVGAVGVAQAAASYPPLTGSITGPAYLGPGAHARYTLNASGGPAQAANGTQVGIYSFHANVSASNISGASVTPAEGVTVNRSAILTVLAPNITETLVLTVQLNASSADGRTNVTTTLTQTIQVVQPYTLKATVQVVGASGIAGFALTVNLDGQPVGTVSVPSLSAGSSYPISFGYVTLGLPAGWHTFSINLASQHGLVVFASGSSLYSVAFYVAGPATDYTVYYILGIVAFVGAIVILLLRVGSRSRARPRK